MLPPQELLEGIPFVFGEDRVGSLQSSLRQELHEFRLRLMPATTTQKRQVERAPLGPRRTPFIARVTCHLYGRFSGVLSHFAYATGVIPS